MSPCNCGATWTGTRAEHCCACHLTFTGTTAGDKHRTGDHAVLTGPTRRRCLAADEMLAKGMNCHLNSAGTPIWGTGVAREWPKSLSQDESPGFAEYDWGITPEHVSEALRNTGVA